jgi:hypothetical protein
MMLLLQNRRDFIAIFILMLIATVSFIHGWYFDLSKPISGMGWADQTYYHRVAEKLASGLPLNAQDFHYQMGYSILGALATTIYTQHPFALVSGFLFLASTILIFRGASMYLKFPLAVGLVLLLFFRWGNVRALYYTQEIFLIPWNNQVTFFTFALFFYLFALMDKGKPLLPWLLVLSSFISGFAITTRLETSLFIVPLLAIILYKQNNIKIGLICMLAFSLGAAPQFIIQYSYFSDVFSNVRPGRYHGSGYLEILQNYVDIDRLKRNLVEVIFNSSYSNSANVRRLALLQAAPWLYLAPIGLIALFLRRDNLYLKIFLVASIMIFLFYLAGTNMAAHKLKFHCIRYITPSFIGLTLAVMYLIERLFYSRFTRDLLPHKS